MREKWVTHAHCIGQSKMETSSFQRMSRKSGNRRLPARRTGKPNFLVNSWDVTVEGGWMQRSQDVVEKHSARGLLRGSYAPSIPSFNSGAPDKTVTISKAPCFNMESHSHLSRTSLCSGVSTYWLTLASTVFRKDIPGWETF